MSTNKRLDLSGSFVALITPMLEDGAVDYKSLSSLVNWHIVSGTQGLVILGTTAEAATLSEREQFEVLACVIEVNRGRLPILVGNGSNSTTATIAKTRKLNELAIDGYLTVTPYYNKPTQKGMIAHFKAVAAATDKPIVLYNVPGRTCVDLINDSVIELMAISNIVGIKDATGDLSRVSILKKASESFALLSGDDLTGREFIEAGGDGVISVTANVEPVLMSQMMQALREQDTDKALTIDDKLTLLHRDLFIEPNPVPAKWALKEKGQIVSDMVRLPLLPLEPIHQQAVKLALQSALI